MALAKQFKVSWLVGCKGSKDVWVISGGVLEMNRKFSAVWLAPCGSVAVAWQMSLSPFEPWEVVNAKLAFVDGSFQSFH